MAWDYEKVVRELQDTMTVVVGIQARHASLLKDQSTWLEPLQERQDAEKLNGLIGYMDNQNRPQG